MRRQRFDRLGCFAYSEEEGTPAAGLEQMPLEEREERAAAVMRIQAEIMEEKQAAKVGETLRVLCDGYDEEEGASVCRTAADAPEIDAVCYVESAEPLTPGCFYDVRVKKALYLPRPKAGETGKNITGARKNAVFAHDGIPKGACPLWQESRGRRPLGRFGRQPNSRRCKR